MTETTLSQTKAARSARARRIRKGVESEAKAKAFTRKIALQSMIEAPLLETLQEMGGAARPKDIYDAIADKMNVDPALRDDVRHCTGQSYRYFEHQVRWARQSAVGKGLIGGERGTWRLTDKAYARLDQQSKGVAVLIYSTKDGSAFWARAEDASAFVDKGSVNLLLTSPPYPVVDREYGRMSVPEWLDWMHHLTGIWKDLIAEDGTIAINVMDVFVPGTPMLSPYVERFLLAAIDGHGLNLAARLAWHSPTKLGSLEWTSKRRVHPKNSLEHVLLLSKSTNPAWDIDRMERPQYAQRTVLKQGRSVRPSGLDIDEAAFARGDGPLPGNLIVAGGASGSDAYSRRCRAAGLQAHPARYPTALPRTIILMTTAPGDLCYDPMAGSNTTGQVASQLGRRFISSEAMPGYARTSAFRFDHRPDFQWHVDPQDLAA